MPKIFICYRRQDSGHQAGRLFDHLSVHFGSEQLFKDVDSMPLGVDFRRVLVDKVCQCDVLLALVGDEWLSAATPDGKRRLDDPSDFVRIEIETALSRNIPVIPVLVGHLSICMPESLPLSLQDFAYRHAIQIRPDPDFQADAQRLIRGIAHLSGNLGQKSSTPRDSAKYYTTTASVLRKAILFICIIMSIILVFIQESSSVFAPLVLSLICAVIPLTSIIWSDWLCHRSIPRSHRTLLNWAVAVVFAGLLGMFAGFAIDLNTQLFNTKWEDNYLNFFIVELLVCIILAPCGIIVIVLYRNLLGNNHTR